MEVRAFGIKDNSTPGVAKRGDAGHASHTFQLLDLGPSPDVSHAELVVLPAEAELSNNSGTQASATDLLVKRVLLASESGGKICVLYGKDPQSTTFVAGQLLRRWAMNVEGSSASLRHVHAPEFQSYLREYGVSGFAFVKNAESELRLHPLAGPSQDAQLLSAFAVAHGNGLVYMVPGNLVAGSELALLSALADSVAAHSAAVLRPSTAPIVQSFVFSEEGELRRARDTKLTELQQLDDSLAEYGCRKDILFLRDRPFEERVPQWIRKYLGIATRRVEEYKEDFWLVGSEGKDAAICEAKALSQNVKREHISQLVLHREERERPDDFPSILVANTFADAATVKQKDNQHIGKLEIAKAVRDHVLVVRTLDLLRLLDHVETGSLPAAEVEHLLLTRTGWLRVTEKGHEVVEK